MVEISNKHGWGRFGPWFHEAFGDLFFRALIGPAQTTGAVDGCDPKTREQWKRDLENRIRYTREQRERRRRTRHSDRYL